MNQSKLRKEQLTLFSNENSAVKFGTYSTAKRTNRLTSASAHLDYFLIDFPSTFHVRASAHQRHHFTESHTLQYMYTPIKKSLRIFNRNEHLVHQFVYHGSRIEALLNVLILRLHTLSTKPSIITPPTKINSFLSD